MKRANLFVYRSYRDPVMSFLKVFLSVLNLQNVLSENYNLNILREWSHVFRKEY